MSVAIPSLRGAIAVPGWAKNELWRKARAVPSLDLRFADSKSLVDATTGQSLITFTRASSGTFVNSAGVIETAASGVPRFDHNPTTGESLGLLVEEQRTNSIRNNTMVGAVAGTPGTLPTNWVQSVLGAGLTSQVVGTGTQGGIAYIDIRVSGTAGDTNGWSVNFDASTTTAASSGQDWTGSVYFAIVGGSTSGTNSQYVRVIERNLVGGYVTESNILWSAAGSVFSPASRISVTRASMGATTGFVQEGVYFNSVNGAAIDITLRIGMPQLEQGAFATSVIPTTSAAATRSADVASITGSAFSGWYRQDEGTVFAEGRSPSTVRVLTAIDDGSMSNRFQVTIAASYTPNFAAVSGGSVSADIYTAALPQGSLASIAAAYKVNDFALSSNGSNVSTDTVGALPVSPSVVRLGVFQNGSGYLNGTIRRLVYWGQRLANNTLQSITS